MNPSFGTFRSPFLPPVWRQALRSYARGTKQELFHLLNDFVRQHKAMHDELLSRMSVLEKTVSRLEQTKEEGSPSNRDCTQDPVRAETRGPEVVAETIEAEGSAVALSRGATALYEAQRLQPPQPVSLGSGELQAPVQDLLQFSGSDADLRVRLMGPRWRRMESGLINCSRPGGLMFDFSPHTKGYSGALNPIRMTLTPDECAQILLLDPEVELRFEHDPKAWTPVQGFVTKSMRWSPAGGNGGMHLEAVLSNKHLGTTESLRVQLLRPQLRLLQCVAGRSIPAMTGFAYSGIGIVFRPRSSSK
eukprot:EG_transcript_21346